MSFKRRLTVASICFDITDELYVGLDSGFVLPGESCGFLIW